MYRLKTTANFNVGGGISGEVIHDSTLMGKGTSESPLKVDQSKFAKPTDLNGKQDKLVSGTNIKTINNQSILGTGNINIEGGEGGTSELSTEVKNAILDCFENVAWTSANGQEYYNTLSELFFPAKSLVSISAVFNQGQNVIYDDATLDSLKQYLTVTALYDDESTETVTDYLLSGTLSAGSSTITVAYEGKTTTFTVNVTARPELSSISAVFTQGDNVIYPSTSLDTLKQYLVVKAIYTDSSEVTLQDSDYTLSGTLTTGTSTITATYEGKTTTFNVTVSAEHTWLYHFNDNLSSSGTKDFGLSVPTSNYITGKFGKAAAITSGTPNTVPRALGISSENLPTFAGDFTISFWSKPETGKVSRTVFRMTKNIGTGLIANSAKNITTFYNGHTIMAETTAKQGYVGVSFVYTSLYPFCYLFTNESTAYGFQFESTSNNILTANVWHHIAICRKNGIVTLYIDGLKWASFPLSSSLYVPNVILFGGSMDATGTEAGITAPQNSNVDEFYINDGLALYDDEFVPPIVPYEN